MFYKIIRSNERGRTKIGWLLSYHTFSFGNYYNPNLMDFGSLRVFNDDVISPNNGFGFHPHSNMEIVTIVLSGELKHFDSLGNTGNLKYGIIQAMCAGSGIMHSEINPSKSENLELFQIWVKPKIMNLEPNYIQSEFKITPNEICRIVSNKDGLISINQDTSICLFESNNLDTLDYISEYKNIYLMVIDGEIDVFEKNLSKRDSILIKEVEKLEIKFKTNSKILIIDTV